MMTYKGYVAATEIDPESGLIFGEVLGLRDVVTFQGHSFAEALRAFHESVDLYLQTCAEQGLEPQQAYSGSIAVRTEPQVHRALAALARARGQSLNALINRLLTRHVRRAGLVDAGRPRPGRPRRRGPATGPGPAVDAGTLSEQGTQGVAKEVAKSRSRGR